MRGDKQYELSNYLGNVETTITDRKTPVVEPNGVVTHYEANAVNAVGYYPFGMQMPGRVAQPQAYRFGYSGLERDDELKGLGNSYYTNARLFDPRVGRWLSPDPVEVAASSPFVGFGNNPIRYADPKGTLLDIPGDKFTPNSTPAPKETVGEDDESTPQSRGSAKYSFGLGLKNEGLRFKDTPFADSNHPALPSATGSNANFGLDRGFRVDLRSPLILPVPRPGAFDFNSQLANAKPLETEGDIHLESQYGVTANATRTTIAPPTIPPPQVSGVLGGVSANNIDVPGGANLTVLNEPNVSLSLTPGSPVPVAGAGIDIVNLSRDKTEVALGAGFSGSTPNISLGAKHNIGFEEKLRLFWQGQIDATGGVSVTGGILFNPGSLLGNKKD
jgi:RHS repeat-associated protein